MSALARVRAVLEAARAVTSGPRRGALEAELRRSSRLSPQGVALALDRHLELQPSDEALALLLARAARTPEPAACHVLLAANVCTAALRALAFAAAVSPRVVVRPSRRDPALADALLGELRGGGFARAERLEPRAGEEAHLHGSDETLAVVPVEPGVRVLRFGSGFGLAFPQGEEDARPLAADVVAFDQRGCLSPRVALVPAERAEPFARALAEALAEAEDVVPRGPLEAGDRAELSRWRAAARALGRTLEGEAFAVGLSEELDVGLVPPPCRVIQVVPCDGLGPRAAGWAARATILGGAGPLFEAARRVAPAARAVPLGEMQRPPLDGPVDLRPLA